MRVENYFELVIYHKYLVLLNNFNALELNICKLLFEGFMSLECYILKKLFG